MNTDHLARHYEVLTPWERLSLLVAAWRVAIRSKKTGWLAPPRRMASRVPDYWGLAEGLDDLVKLYLLEQLDLTALYWRFAGLLEQESWDRPSRQERQRQERRWQLLKMLAYRYVVRADGWRLLCAELPIDPDVLLKELPGYDAVQQMEQVARLIAFRAEEALAFLRADAEASRPAEDERPAVRREYQMVTAADVAQSMRAFLQARLDAWR